MCSLALHLYTLANSPPTSLKNLVPHISEHINVQSTWHQKGKRAVLTFGAFSLIWMRCLRSKVQLLGHFKCFPLSYRSKSSDRCSPRSILRLPGLSSCPNISGSRPQVWWGVLSVSLGGLQLTMRLCGQRCWSADHPAGSCSHNASQARAGNRKQEEESRTSCSSSSAC